MALSAEQESEIQTLLNSSPYSDAEIAKRVGCSHPTVWKRRRAMNDKTSAEIRKDFGIEETVYRGGGEW